MGVLIENAVTEQHLYEHEQLTAFIRGLAMVHLLSAVKLKSSVSFAAFAEAIRQLSASLEQQQLLTTTGPIGKRFPHPIMDTDEADLETFFIMSFEDRDQLDRYRFTCWED